MTIEEAKEKGVTILDEAPAGWKRFDGCTAPRGYAWYWNQKSLFGGYEDALVKEAGFDGKPEM